MAPISPLPLKRMISPQSWLVRISPDLDAQLMCSASSSTTPYASTPPVFARLGDHGVGDESIRQLCDAVRTSLQEDKTLGPRADEIKKLLLSIFKGECLDALQISFETVCNAHLDKLLVDMLSTSNASSSATDESRANTKIAQSLQKAWQVRFQGDYFRIDHKRLNRLKFVGRLKDMEFVGPRPGTRELWQAKSKDTLSDLEEDRHFEPGDWWLNLACAHRDGIVGSVKETLSKGRYDHAALPLMTGYENVWPDKSEYIRLGSMAEMHISLMTRVGTSVRILRGYGLQSHFAPAAGIRYDGKYKLLQYGVVLKPHLGKYQLTLTLQRLTMDDEGRLLEVNRGPGTMDSVLSRTRSTSLYKHMKDIVAHPSPSEMDDWKLYEMYESELMKKRMGNSVFMNWSLEKGKRQGEKENWRRIDDLKNELKHIWKAMGV